MLSFIIIFVNAIYVSLSTREVLLNVTNELYKTDVYNVMGVIKGSTHPGNLSNSTSEESYNLCIRLLLIELQSTIFLQKKMESIEENIKSWT